MRGRTHLILGSLSSIELAILYKVPLGPIGLASILLCTVVADLDESNSNVMNKVISKDSTKKLYNILSYALVILLFYFSQRLKNNLYIGIGFSILLVNLISKKFTAGKLRSILISGLFILLALIFYLFDINMGLVFISSLLAVFPFLSHRKLTHSLLMLVIVYFLVRMVEIETGLHYIAILSTFAYSSHIVLDMVTKMGVPLFYPLSSKNYSILGLKVGSLFCNLVEYLLIIIMSVILLVSLMEVGLKTSFL